MSVFAPPVRRGDFLYSSVLYADAGNSNHHPRASIAELAALLRPEAPNLYKNNARKSEPIPPTPAKDPPWHYYSAQCLHYGLPFTKDKNAAKVRLLNALNGLKLEVPAWVLGMESELRKEWEGANAKMKKGAKGKKSEEAGTKAKKAGSKSTSNGGASGIGQNMNNNVNVTVNLSLPSGLSGFEQFSQTSNNSPGPQKPTPGKRKRKDDDNAPSNSTPAKKPSTVKARASATNSAPAASLQPKKPRAKKETAANTPFSSQTSPTGSPSIKHEQQQSNAKSTSTPRVKKGPQLKKETQPKKESQPKKEPQPKNPPGIKSETSSTSDLILSGTYHITSPVTTTFFPYLNPSTLTLTLYRNLSRSLWWATFSWGAWQCIMQLNPGPTDASLKNVPHTFGYRLRDLETGVLRFGRGCTGEMVFLTPEDPIKDRVMVRGFLENVPRAGEVRFWGERMVGIGCEGDFMEEWDGFVREAYGR